MFSGSSRSRRAHRELQGYLTSIYGPQESLSIREWKRLDCVRVLLTVSGTAAPTAEHDAATPPTHAQRRHSRADVAIVEDLAARLVGIRSVRYAPGGGLVPEDADDAEYELHSDFPTLFPIGTLELGVPWLELVRAAAEVLMAKDILAGLKSSQVKSKFASVRWYFEAGPQEDRAEVGAVLVALELLSTVVCETCGSPGRERVGGWHVIRCDACQDIVDRERKKKDRRGG